MSLYFCSAGADLDRLERISLELSHPGKHARICAGTPGWLWVDDQPERFGPAVDEATGITVITSGRLAWSVPEWAEAERLTYQGGLANRLILQRYLKGGVNKVAPYNGAVVIIIHDPRSLETHVWTDQFGYHPCFIYAGDAAEQCIITTFPDLLLADGLAKLTDDLVSMAEFIKAWRATPPNTYFREVKHVGAATHLTIHSHNNKISSRVYWTPFEEEFYPNISAASEELASAVGLAIAERTAIAKHPVFFISGGADSRVLLYSAVNRNLVTGVHLYERASAELDIARELCQMAGSRFIALQRDNDYYPRNLADTVKWSGAMWSAEDTHYPGFIEALTELEPDLVMTACTTDWLFKAYGMEKRHKTLFGRNLPIFEYINQRADCFLPNMPLTTKTVYESEMAHRFAEWFKECPKSITTARDRLRIEDRRIRPTAYTVSVSGSVMYRRFPYDTFLADSRIATCYSRTHPDWKLNRELWGRAATRICGGAGKIVDANYGCRLDATDIEKLGAFAAGWFRRRFKPETRLMHGEDGRPPSTGSWPDFGWYAKNSPTLRQLWESAVGDEIDKMTQISGHNPWSKPLESWGNQGLELFRIVTLLSYWRISAHRQNKP